MEPTVNILQVILSLMLVIGLIGICALVLKRLQQSSGWLQNLSQGQQLKLIERMMIDTKTRIVVAKWKDREYLILVHANGAQVLDVEESNPDVT